ncbi:MAG: PilN domain-containing protein [Verrucomicrobiota bacterium]|nr:PilN domain-containing protein [Verrucomicrobiota bacterium]
MRIRDKIITAACRTPDGIEWTTLKIKQDGNETVEQGAQPLVLPDEISEEALSAIQLPEGIAEHLAGDITVALRTSELLMHTMEFPTADPSEIADMVGFQIDKVSPFPLDQLAVAHEILRDNGESADVLMAAAKRECIDAIGDAFEKTGVHIHSMDARVLGWMQLLHDKEHLTSTGCEIFIIDDGIDFSLVILFNGMPIAFRSLHAQVDDMNVVDELTYEIGYTLTTLDAGHDLPTPSAIQFWIHGDVPSPLRAKLGDKTGIKVLHHDLGILPPLSEGIVQRALQAENRIELIPREWIEHEQRQMLRKKFTLISAAIAAVWLLVLLIFFSVYNVRNMKLAGIQADADAIKPAAEQALQNRKKLKALKAYTDRSDSSLECLREVTHLLPVGDIEFVSFNYTKGKAVSLRGTARSDDIVNDFFSTLTKSSLFDRIKDESVTTKTTKGVRRAVFSVTLVFPAEEAGK